MKAQMSMEMVIGILILIIVAAVVINMFFKSTTDIGGIKKYQEDMAYRSFKSMCEGLCNDYVSSGQAGSIVKYCYSKMENPPNKATVKTDVLQAERGGVVPICGDAIYCFHAVECTHPQRGAIGWEDCRNILCDAYYDFYRDPGKASEKVLELYKKYPEGNPDEESRAGSCYSKIKKEENWWNLYFARNGQLPCGGLLTSTTTSAATATTTTAAQTASLSCLAKGKAINCQWSNCPTSKCYLLCSIEGGGNCAEPMKEFDQADKEYIYISMKTGSTYNFNLQDANFQKIAGPSTVACCQ